MPISDPFSEIDLMEPVATAVDKRRGAARRRMLKPAKIARIDAKSLIDCQLRDLSETGARLRCSALGAVPNDFYLIFPVEGTRRLAKVAWRRGEEIGVHFVGDKEPIPRRKG
jgi:hypothetical protein